VDAEARQVLVLVRHGEAAAGAADHDRPLTSLGRRQSKLVATWLARLRLPLVEVRHSGKRRAEQTAELLAGALKLPTRAVTGLGPEDAPEATLDGVEVEEASVALVGHLPHLACLASLALTGRSRGAALRFDKAAVAVLVRERAGWQLLALVTPAQLGG